jgi:hypothetical protein
MRTILCLLTLVACLAGACASDDPAPTASEGSDNMYARWQQGPPTGSDYFPIAVWLQDPANAARYREAGINLYVGLWQGPTEAQLAGLRVAGMQVVCDQNEVGLQHLDDPTIVGWMHGDEPDNAQADGSGGWGPPILPETIVASYSRLRAADPSRPILLNLGQGVAWDGWIGRGVRTNHPEDYPEYVRGADIVSFDIYPVASDRAEVSGNLWYVAHGVERLRAWAAPEQPVWNCIECSRIYNANKATPAQVKAEVWMALIHGSNGLIYFVHEWYPKFNEHALLDDPEMLAAVTAVNRQIHELAPVLNSTTVQDGVSVTSSDPEIPVAAMVKQVKGSTYLFAVAMRGSAVNATFAVSGLPAQAQAEVLGEGRTVAVTQGRWTDAFEPWGVHLYRIR